MCTLVGATGFCLPAYDATTNDVSSDNTIADAMLDADGGDASVTDANADAGDAGNAPDGCTNLQCQQTCSTTSISGKVFDPAGVNALYDVLVYVPNAALSTITDGPVAAQCPAPASGSPIAWTTTAADGTFKLTNAPSGTNIPIVLQIGKWRRHLTIPTVTACVDNPQSNGSLRLPRKQHETSQDDNVPLMALTTGCDAVECFLLQRIGIDQAEFTGSSGNGRVRVYKSGNDDGQTFPNYGNNAQSASYLWDTKAELVKYDIVIDACECSPFSRGTNGYTNMLSYLNAGGRALTTHYFYNFFATQQQCGGDTTCQGPTPLPAVASWLANQGLSFAPDSPDCPNDSYGGSCLTINTQFPRGKAFADWYKASYSILQTGGGEAYGYAGLRSTAERRFRTFTSVRHRLAIPELLPEQREQRRPSAERSRAGVPLLRPGDVHPRRHASAGDATSEIEDSSAIATDVVASGRRPCAPLRDRAWMSSSASWTQCAT